MKKLHLRLDDLEVDSFATAETEGEKGTVEAYVSARCNTNFTCGGGYSCNYAETCGAWPSCYVTCHASCPAPCDDPTFYATDCDTCYAPSDCGC